jgi:hypothetical protein
MDVLMQKKIPISDEVNGNLKFWLWRIEVVIEQPLAIFFQAIFEK